MILAQFEIPIVVLPKGNSRQAFVNKRTGKMCIPTDSKVKKNAKALVDYCLYLLPRTIAPYAFLGGLRVTYVFKFPWRKTDAEKRLRGMTVSDVRCTGPDLGNLTKNMDDVLQKAGFFANDTQISCYGETRKRWADRGGVSVTIERDE